MSSSGQDAFHIEEVVTCDIDGCTFLGITYGIFDPEISHGTFGWTCPDCDEFHEEKLC
ncbi:hypothetical protein QMG61_05425 [Cryobacterium sp. PH31-AA6]|uniref:hypothetical protein n=1 Tax=Cryobacterium sp. PH31-AA6 TaxID=3046205 RepID=UPI0024BAFDC3|nr:hypothetical protein [Cryobacterium sp. PH31-AA6]MDJ0323203.1 hypothetical protein [Cryobacterium sp. PH31-AA6]